MGDDTLNGNDGADELNGGSGDDHLSGDGGSPDICNGQTGTDTAAESCERITNVP